MISDLSNLFQGPNVEDTEIWMAEQRHQQNVGEIMAMYTAESPDTLDRDEVYWGEAAYKAREMSQERALDEFSLAVVNANLRALNTSKARIMQGLAGLEQQFLQEPTYLGAANAEFDTFLDTAVCSRSGDQPGLF